MKNVKNSKKGMIVSLIISGILLLVVGLYYMSISNAEIDLKNQATAQQTVCEGYMDKMWKTIKQQAEVSSEYKDAFAKIYPELISGRYGTETGGSLMKWIQESNPDFDTALYGKLMNTIEAQREGFFNEQKTLISIKKQHEDLLAKAPSSWFIGGRDKLSIIIITSNQTKEIFETGEENDVDLF
jgi:hypothetical protein